MTDPLFPQKPIREMTREEYAAYRRALDEDLQGADRAWNEWCDLHLIIRDRP